MEGWAPGRSEAVAVKGWAVTMSKRLATGGAKGQNVQGLGGPAGEPSEGRKGKGAGWPDHRMAKGRDGQGPEGLDGWTF